MFNISYMNDIEQIGLSQNAFRNNNVLTSFLRRNPLNKLSKIELAKLSYTREWFEGFSSTVVLRRTQFSPLGIMPEFQFINQPFVENGNSITSSEIVVRSRWAHKEQYLAGEFDRISLGTKKPMPTHWATDDLKNIDFDVIRYYLAKGQRPSRQVRIGAIGTKKVRCSKTRP